MQTHMVSTACYIVRAALRNKSFSSTSKFLIPFFRFISFPPLFFISYFLFSLHLRTPHLSFPSISPHFSSHSYHTIHSHNSILRYELRHDQSHRSNNTLGYPGSVLLKTALVNQQVRRQRCCSLAASLFTSLSSSYPPSYPLSFPASYPPSLLLYLRHLLSFCTLIIPIFSFHFSFVFSTLSSYFTFLFLSSNFYFTHIYFHFHFLLIGFRGA